MKKPSIDAIRRFKEQQERRKLQEEEKKIQEKLSTLEHRAAQGDRKAKTELKIIEKVKEDRSKQPEVRPRDIKKDNSNGHSSTSRNGGRPIQTNGGKPKKAVTDFDELMRLAAGNKNEVKREEPKRPPPPVKIARKPREAPMKLAEVPSTSRSQTCNQPQQYKPQTNKPVKPIPRPPPPPLQAMLARHVPSRNDYYEDEDEDDYDDDYEDDYEQDGFVVDEDDAETQNEVSKTIRSVFGYDKRRCDLREAELDRQYRQIGRVTTFEDLEREERRASKAAANEDAQALREEEERKRLKRLRMKGQR